MVGSEDGLRLKTQQSYKIVNELGLSGKDLSKMQSFLKFIITNQETPSALNENIATLIKKKNAYTYAISGIIKATKKDIARLSGAVLNSALSIPLDLLKLECIQYILDEIQKKLDRMPVEALYKVYTSSFPPAIFIAGVKTKIDNAINDFLNDQCKENIPKLTAVIDVAYNAAKEASDAIDRIAGEKETTQHDEDLQNTMVDELNTHKKTIGGLLENSKASAFKTAKELQQRVNTGIADHNRLKDSGALKNLMVKKDYDKARARVEATRSAGRDVGQQAADRAKTFADRLGASSSMQTHSTAMMTPPPTLISISVKRGKNPAHNLKNLDADSMTVDELKAKLHLLTNVPADMMRLVANGKTLTTGTLGENKLKEGAKLRLIGNTKAAVVAANLAPDGDGGEGLLDGNLATEKHNIRRILNNNQSKTYISNPPISTENIIRKIAVTAGGAKSYMRKPHRRRTRHHKTQRRRTRHYKTRRNSKKPRRRTIRRKKRHKRRTR